MKTRRILILSFILMAFVQSAFAQTSNPVALVLTADGAVMPPMRDYIRRGLETAQQRNVDMVVIKLNTPGGQVDTMLEIITDIRASEIPVVVYVAPKNAIAASAGALITMAGHVSAMAPDTSIGAASPITSSGENLNSTADAKTKEMIKASIRGYVTPRGEEAVQLAEAMVDEAKAVTAEEALDVNLIDFVADDLEDLLQAMNGYAVQMEAGPITLNTEDIEVQPLNLSLIEQLLSLLTDPNIVFTLLSLGTLALLVEISSPGGWVAGFIGAVCLTVALYGIGLLSVNWFGIIFLAIAFVLFLLDLKASTHGALTTAGAASFVVGALVLFNSPGTPDFQRVSVPLVIGTGIAIGLLFFAALLVVMRIRHTPIQTGSESILGKTGTAQSFEGEAGQVQVDAELWSAEKARESSPISKGDKIEVVEVRGLRLIVKKK